MARIELYEAPNSVIEKRVEKAAKEKQIQTKDRIILSFFWANKSLEITRPKMRAAFAGWGMSGFTPGKLDASVLRLIKANLVEDKNGILRAVTE